MRTLLRSCLESSDKTTRNNTNKRASASFVRRLLSLWASRGRAVAADHRDSHSCLTLWNARRSRRREQAALHASPLVTSPAERPRRQMILETERYLNSSHGAVWALRGAASSSC